MNPLSFLSIIIVGWNSKDLIKLCLESLTRSTQTHFTLSEVILVDNASTDETGPYFQNLQGEYPFSLTVLQNQVNVGFGRACNQGVSAATSEFVLLLNPDAEVFPSTLDDLFLKIQSTQNSQVRLWSIRQVDPQGHTHISCRRLPKLRYYFAEWLLLNRLFPRQFWGHSMQEWDHCSTRIVEHPMGAFYVMRKQDYEALGGFDSRFFVYGEDADFCKRLIHSGYQAMYLGDVVFSHRLNATTESIKPLRTFYAMQGNWIYSRIWFSGLSRAVFSGMYVLGYPILRMLGFLVVGNREGLSHFIQGWMLFIRRCVLNHESHSR
jgi:N-acetylglucosaminyl-diphospho-decaprenol L-rhamnosyltransferase